VDSHETTIPSPFGEDLSLEKPCCSTYVESFTRDVVVYRRIRRREPISNFLPQLITCEIVLDTTAKGTRGPQTLHPVDFIRHPLHSDLRPLLVESNTGWFKRDIWRVFSVDAFRHRQNRKLSNLDREMSQEGSRTVHHHFHSVHKAMKYF
jgi:hypothetical protein